FEFLYLRKNWTHRELEQQKRVMRNSQAISMFFSCLGVCAGLWSMSAASLDFGLIFAVGGFLLSMIATALFAVQTVRFALYAAQLDERCLFSWNQFVGRIDFWRKVLLPYS